MRKNAFAKQLDFELRSAVYRFLQLDSPRITADSPILNLGCGQAYVPGMVNADFFPATHQVWRTPSLEWHLDLRYPLNCPSDVFAGVFCEHTLEHLSPDHGKRLLRELLRIMQPGAFLRLTVPDLRKYVQFYLIGSGGGNPHPRFQEKFGSGVRAIHALTQNFGHVSVWDYNELAAVLEQSGFTSVREATFGDCADERLCHDREGRAWETLYVEAQKPA
jgi:predicted SAM-dependent methyltransferase